MDPIVKAAIVLITFGIVSCFCMSVYFCRSRLFTENESNIAADSNLGEEERRERERLRMERRLRVLEIKLSLTKFGNIKNSK